MNLTNFVNDCRNIVWVSGYAKGGEGNELLLYQSSNADRAIPIQVSPRVRRPRPNTPVEIKCHAFGTRDEQGRQRMRLEAIQIKRAGVANAPSRIVMQNALRPASALEAPGATPFDSLEKVKDEIRTGLRLEEQLVNDLLADSARRGGKSGGFVNKVFLSGFVRSKAYVPPSDDGSGDLGHVRLHLCQHPQAEKSLEVCIQGANSEFGKLLKLLAPLSIVGELRVAVVKDDAGNIIERRPYISTDKNNVGAGVISDFARDAFPGWWREAALAVNAEKRAAAEAAAATRAAVAATPAAPAAPSGVQVTDDVF